jgi:PBP4 family serine-type D-alanyl-D-alanine carboxypeptidase
MRFSGWRFKVLSLLFALLLMVTMVPPVFAENAKNPQDVQNPDERLAETLRHFVEQLKADPNSEGEVVGYEVYSLDRKKTLASLREEKTFVPASVMKLLVTSTAVSLWPKSLRIPTKVYLDGQLTRGGVLHGDIDLKGYGDPVLTVKKLDQLAKALADRGVRRVHGDLVVDDSYFSGNRLGEGWMWDDEPYDYSSQIAALSVNHNTVDVKVKPTKIGKKPKVSVRPAPEYVKVVNDAKTIEGAKEDLTLDRTRAKNEIVISGTIGKTYEDDGKKFYKDVVTIDDPPRFTGTVFRDLLQKHGISFHPKSRIVAGKVDHHADLAGEVDSPKLDKMLRKMDKESSNFIAEMLTKQLGARERGEGTTETGVDVIGDFVQDELGVDDDFIQKDGSGLTRLDHISPHDYIQLLKAMDDSAKRDRFVSFLPVAGVDGTLKKRMKDTPAEGNVTAKTGSMSGVNSLVGYVTGKNGERFAFSILINGIYKSKYATKLQDDISIALAKYPNLPETKPLPRENDQYPLSEKLDPILNDDHFKGVIKGAEVYSLDRDKLLYARNRKSLLTPGSGAKLLTAATALAELGSDYRFRTEMYTTGAIRRGVLHGNVIVKGYGDPTLAIKGPLRVLNGPTINEMAEDIKKLGIHRVQGNIIVDDSAFSGGVYPIGWMWDQESQPIQPQITALSVNQGTVGVMYKPGRRSGRKIQVTLTPKTDNVHVINHAVTGRAGSEDTLQIQRDRATNTIRVTGSLSVDADDGFTRVTVENPELYTGHVLQEQLKKEGVRFHPHSQVHSGTTADDAKLVQTYHSPPLSEIVRYQNHYNDNFIAEMILKTLGAEIKEEGRGTFDDGIDVIHDYMESLGIQSRFDMMDGSGHTGYNQMSADLMVSLLKAEKQQPTFDDFYDSLAVAGEKGILQNGMNGTVAEHRLRGITGMISDIRGLSGYVKTTDGELLAYSILANGASKESLSQLVNRFGAALAEVPKDR